MKAQGMAVPAMRRQPAVRYLAPATVIMAAMLGFPIVYNLVLSFYQWTLKSSEHPFVGLGNYIEILSGGKFVQIFVNSIIWTGVGVLLQMVIGIGLALFVDNLVRGKQFMRIILLVPWIIPGVVTALMWKWLLQSDVGLINYLLMESGITDDNTLFFSDPKLALFTLILVNTWKAVPFWFLMITAGLQTKPDDQIEAARLDGAGVVQVFRHVTLPHLSPVIASTGVLTTIWTLNYFDLIWVMTKGGPANATTTLPIFIYREAFEFNDFGASAACAVLSFLIVASISIPYMRKMFSNLKSEGVL
ncbi:MAG: sugar ABC transporter permease [Clostridiales Family XIII bacterium]|nr:sugar ABC transporter permease [Clostridiales Family XIII bacterium]